MNCLKFAVLLISIPFILKAQIENAAHYSNDIVNFRNNDITSLVQTSESYENHGNLDHMIQSSNQIGINIFYREDFESFFLYFLRGLEKSSNALTNKHDKIITGYNILGWAYFIQGYFKNAVHFWGKGIKLIESSSREDELAKCYFYINLALAFNQKGDNGLATEYYERALPVLKRNYNKLEFSEEKIICGIYLSHNFNVFSMYENSLEILSELGQEINYKLRGNKNLISSIYYLIGHTYKNMGLLVKSLQSFSKSYIFLRSNNIEDSYMTFQVYRSLAEIYYSQNKKEMAIEEMIRALNTAKNLLGEYHAETLSCYEWLGHIYQEENNLIEALKYYELSIEGNLNRNINSKNKFVEDDYFLDSFLNKAKILTEILEDTFNEEKNLIQAFNLYKLASELIEKIRRSYKTDESKLLLSERASKLYKGAVNTSLKLFKITGIDEYKEEAFIFAEKNKAGILNESLTETLAKTFGNIPDSLLKKEKELRTSLTFYETEINKEEAKGKLKDSLILIRYKKIFFDINIEHQKLLSDFENNYPDYFEIKYKINDLSVKDIQDDLLDKNTTLVEYFIADSILYIFVINKSACDVYTTDLIDDKLVTNFNNAIYNIDTEEYVEIGYSLYKKLIETINGDLKEKLIIIPDGNIHNIPFDALLTKRIDYSSDINFRKLPYLINKFELSYSYSASMKCYSNSNTNHRNYKTEFIGFAPVFEENRKTTIPRYIASSLRNEITTEKKVSRRSVLNNDGNFKWLPSSEMELVNIYNMFAEKDLPATIYLNLDASEDRVKKEMDHDSKFVHFATHAFINYKNIELSGIALYPDYENNEDGILYINEIHNFNLNADLAVLSACESGLGSYAKGEGIIGLTRGFIYSGANNLVVTLWEVLDKSTSDLMTNFYSSILEGETYSSSLRKSKLAFIESDIYSAPFFWAPFVLVGN